MPALRTKEQEIMDFVDIYLKAGNKRKEVKKKLKESYTKDEDIAFGLKYFDTQMKEISERKHGKGEVIKKNFSFIAVALALVVFFTVVYIVFFENNYFKENTCSNETVFIELKGNLFFRKAVSERIRNVMKKDCEGFELIAENIKGIEFMKGVNGLLDEKNGRIFVGSYGNEGSWYTVLLVKAACMFKALNENPDINQTQMELDCFERAAVAVEKVHKNEKLAAFLRQKPASRDWREFWLYKEQ